MQTWEQIIYTALVGTDKRPPGANELPEALSEAAALIQQSTTDKEEQFLQLASLAFNYRQCGTMPVKKDSVTIEKAGAVNNGLKLPSRLQMHGGHHQSIHIG